MSNQIAVEIQNVVDTLIQKYNNRLSREFHIQKELLDDLWKNCVIDPPCASPINPFDLVKPTVHLTTKISTCEYTFAKGEKHGEKCKNSTLEGEKFCSLHNYHTSSTSQKEASLTPSPSPSGPKIPGFFKHQKTTVATDLVEPVQDSFFRVKLSKDFDRFFCVNSGFVIKSEEEYSVVIGKRNGTIIDRLNKSEIEKVIKMSMKYEPFNPEWKKDVILDEEVDFSLVDANDLPHIASLDLSKDDAPHSSSNPTPDPVVSKKVKFTEMLEVDDAPHSSSNPDPVVSKKIDKKRSLEIAEYEDAVPSPTTKKRSNDDKSVGVVIFDDDDEEEEIENHETIIFDDDSETEERVMYE